MTFPRKTPRPKIRSLPPVGAGPSVSYVERQKPALQQFVVTRGLRSKYPKAFASPVSLKLYKDYHSLMRSARIHSHFMDAKENQNKAIGLPLLVTKKGKKSTFGESIHFRVDKPEPRPKATHRLYRSEDNVPSGHVLRKGFFTYTRYTIFVKGVETVVFAHKRLPILDVTFQEQRFRLVRQRTRWSVSWREDFVYDIYLLSPDQASLADNMTPDRTVGKSNPILGGFLSYILPTPGHSRFLNSLLSDHRCGQIEYHHKGNKLTHSREHITLTLPTEAAARGQQNTNNAVDDRSLMFVALTFVVQTIEKDLQAKLRRASNHSTTTSNHLAHRP